MGKEVIWNDALGNPIQIRPGMIIAVTFGSNGTQKARVVRITRTGAVKVTKYQARSGRWTKPRTIYQSEFIGRYYV